MASENMYRLAFQYKEKKLWKTLSDLELYAVRLSDDEIGYCCVMGMQGRHVALAVYPGQEGYASYRYSLACAENPSPANTAEMMTAQDCLQCSFEKKEILSEEEIREVRSYAEKNGKTLRGRGAFPQFVKYRPGKYPWQFDSDEDEKRICDALEASIWLADLLMTESPEAIGLFGQEGEKRELPLLVREGGTWLLRKTELPSEERAWPKPALDNEVLPVRIRQMKKSGIWECGTFYLPTPVQDPENDREAPYFPLVLLSVNREDGEIVSSVMGITDEPMEIQRDFAERIILENRCARTLYAGDDRCFALLENLCLSTGVRIVRKNNLRQFEEARDSMLRYVEDEKREPDEEDESGWEYPDEDETDPAEPESAADLDQFFETLMKMRDEELKTMPADFRNMVFELAEYNLVPEELIRRMKNLFR